MTIVVALQVAAMVAGPLAFAAWLRARWRTSWSLFGAGAAGFVGSQVVHVPILVALHPAMRALPLPALAIVLGLLAGACEEPARWLVLRFWLKGARSWREGATVGLGHGGIESAIFGALVALSFLGAVAVPQDAPGPLRAAAQATLDAPAGVRLAAGLERAMAITFHVGASLLVLRAVVMRRAAWLGLAIAMHALFDALAVWAHARFGMAAAESAGAIGALASVVVIATTRDRRARAEGAHDAPSGAAISCRGLTKTFGDRTVVDGLDLDVGRGEVFALLGPNGAGKTTTVRMLCALVGPTAGAARVAGHSVTLDPDAAHAKIGILTETPGLYERLSALRNLDLFARLHGLDARTRAERIERLLRAFDLWDRRDEPVSGFSKGMKQKVAIARALLHDPEVVFLDEPTSGLDPLAAREVLDTIVELKKHGRTILLTTHRLEEAEELATRVGIFKTRMLAQGAFDELRARMYGRQVSVRVARKNDALADVARAQGGATDARWDGDALVVSMADPDAHTPGLVRALVAAGAEIRAVGEVKHSLEEVYKDLVERAP